MMRRNSLAGAGVLLLLVSAVHAEKAPLTLEVAEHATGYMEWMLDARFTAVQRQQYQQMLARMWRGNDEGAAGAIAKMAQVHEALGSVSDSERAQKLAAAQKSFIRLLESAGDEDSRWLLGIHRGARTDAGLLGRWADGHISSIQYQNAYTAVSAPTNGRSFAYDFKSDGTYSFTGLMQSVAYNCTTSMFSNETGTYSVDGDSISLRPEKNPYRMTNNCAPSSNREAPGKLINRAYHFRVISEDGRRYLELLGDDGAMQKFGESR